MAQVIRRPQMSASDISRMLQDSVDTRMQQIMLQNSLNPSAAAVQQPQQNPNGGTFSANNNIGQIISITFDTNSQATAQSVLLFDIYNIVATTFASTKFPITYPDGFTSTHIPNAGEQTSTYLLGGDGLPPTRTQRLQAWAQIGGLIRNITIRSIQNSSHKFNIYVGNGSGSAILKPQSVARAKRPFDGIYEYDLTGGGQYSGVMIDEFCGIEIIIPIGEYAIMDIDIVGKASLQNIHVTPVNML